MSAASTVREWAIAKGYSVGKRGRLSAEVIAAFNARRKPVNQYVEGLA